jgi:hypothetical protein
MNEIGTQAIKVFAGGIGTPIKPRYRIAIVLYPPMKGIPMCTGMRNAGNPFLLKRLIFM